MYNKVLSHKISVSFLLIIFCSFFLDLLYAQWLETTLYVPDSLSGMHDPHTFTYNATNNKIYGGGEQAERQELPKELSLTTSSPISTAGKLKLSYGLPKDERIRLVVYDLLGRETMILKDEKMNAGYYTDAFNLNKLSRGIYWLLLKSGNETKTKKLVLIK
jgi:hypothetical protein